MRGFTVKIPYAGKERRGFDAAMRRGGPIGLRGVALLRRVLAAAGPYRCERNGDEEIAWRCIEAGFLRLDSRYDEILHLTAEGRAYVNRVTRST